MCFQDEELKTSLQLNLLSQLDESKHVIDHIAKKYLEKTSKSVQYLIPIKTPEDENCLYHAIITLAQNCEISAGELKGLSCATYAHLFKCFSNKCDNANILILVRTIVELINNKTEYLNQCSLSIDSFHEALRRTCHNTQFCQLYELVALTNVIQYEIQSVYPYIDYRAQMKVMNCIYRPTVQMSSNIKRVFIFWTNTKDELTVKAHPDHDGIWSPNHFVPLVQANRGSRVRTSEEVIATFQVYNVKAKINNNMPIRTILSL